MAGKIIDFFDETGDSKFQSVDQMLERAGKIKDADSGIVILIEHMGERAFDVSVLVSNLDVAETNLMLDHVKQKLIGPDILNSL